MPPIDYRVAATSLKLVAGQLKLVDTSAAGLAERLSYRAPKDEIARVRSGFAVAIGNAALTTAVDQARQAVELLDGSAEPGAAKFGRIVRLSVLEPFEKFVTSVAPIDAANVSIDQLHQIRIMARTITSAAERIDQELLRQPTIVDR